jgi:hypothetical protein
MAGVVVAALLAGWLGADRSAAGGKDGKLPADVVKVLEAAEQIELSSVDPGDGKVDGEWKVLGKTVVKDAAQRKQVLEALGKSVAEGKSPAKCFEPRHIIRASSGGKTVELVICFACDRLHLTADKGGYKVVPISASAQPVLDKILKDAGIPLAK